MKNNGIWALTMMLMLGSSFASTCYQETANATSECGGLDTGTYATEIIGTGDNNGDGVVTYINYTKPTGATSSSIWSTLGASETTDIVNNSIPISCWNYDSSTLMLRITGLKENMASNPVAIECYNGTWYQISRSTTMPSVGAGVSNTVAYDADWATCVQYYAFGSYSVSSSVEGARMCEEGMYWDIGSTSPTSNATTGVNLTIQNSNPSVVWMGNVSTRDPTTCTDTAIESIQMNISDADGYADISPEKSNMQLYI